MGGAQDAPGGSWLQGKGHSPEPWEAQGKRTAEKKPMFLRNLLCAGPCSRHLPLCAVVYNSAKETFGRDSAFEIQGFAQGHTKGELRLKSKATRAGEEEAKEGSGRPTCSGAPLGTGSSKERVRGPGLLPSVPLKVGESVTVQTGLDSSAT